MQSMSDLHFHLRHRVGQKWHAQEVTYSLEGLPSFWLMAVPEGQRDQSSIKKMIIFELRHMKEPYIS